MSSNKVPLCPVRAGIERDERSVHFKNNPGASWPPGGPGHPCQCKNFKDGKEIKQHCPKMVYVQPVVPSSFKPVSAYKTPDSGLEVDTVYKLSYMGHATHDRVKPVKQKDNLYSAGDFSNDTTQKMSYPGWPCAEPAEPIMPSTRRMFDDGPLQSQTTNRHDYTPKPYSKMLPFFPCGQLKPSDKPMEDMSTMLASYQAPDHSKLDPATSFRPEKTYKKPSAPFAGNTIHKMSYVPWPLNEKEEFPWALKKKYAPPSQAMDGDTIYNSSYLKPKGERRSPFLPNPNGNVITTSKEFDDGTIYKGSYLPNESLKRASAIKQQDNIQRSTKQFATDTTQKMSYPGWPCAEPAEPIMPSTRRMFDDGPLQSQTTNRHDYTPKPYSKMLPFFPCGQLKPSDKPMEDMSTMLASYQAPDHSKLDPATSFRPEKTYKKPSAPFAGNTIHKMSYVPWPLNEKEEFPWALKKKYAPPSQAMDGDTIYNSSYLKPEGERRSPFLPNPNGNVITSSKEFDDTTIYKGSYLPNESLKRASAIKQKDNIQRSTKQFATDTTQKMSYPGWPCAEPAEPIMPSTRRMFDEGPLQSQTTNRHDYTPKPYSKMLPFFPCGQLKPSDKPMEDMSTMLASYQAPDHSKLDPATSFRPEKTYKKPSAPFAGNTIHKMSYVPWPLKEKEEFPWAMKKKYMAPESAMEGDTIYHMSYPAPGRYMPAEKEDGGCQCCYPGECMEPPPPTMQPKSSQGCGCKVPNECLN